MRTLPALTGILFAALTLAGCSPAPGERVNTGYIEVDWLYVASPGAGWIVDAAVHEGAHVEPGQVLFRLDDTAEQARLRAAQATLAEALARQENLATGARQPEIGVLQARLAESEAARDRAQAELARVQPLVERGIETAARGDAVTASYRQAVAAVQAAGENLAVALQAARPAERAAAAAAVTAAAAHRDDAQWQLQQREIRAVAAGKVEEVFLTAGEYALAGTPVLSIFPDNALKARFFVPQALLSQLAPGKTVLVMADGAEGEVPATVSYISGDAEYTPPVIYSEGAREKLVFLVEASLPPGAALRPGLPVEVSW
ncbi:MAG: HlyD family efflux transporter periplasmic adaptor subunit [Halioglobus sp.]